MVNEELFGPWGRVLVTAAGAVIVVLLLLILACFFTPGCIGYECIRKRKKVTKALPILRCKQTDNVKLNDVSYRSWRLGSLYENGNGVIQENVESRQGDQFNQVDSVDASSTLNLIGQEKRKPEKKQKEFPTELTMSLQYLPACEEAIPGKLVIGIEALCGLPPKQYNCTLEPYVALSIVKRSWSHRNRQQLHSFRTRGVRHTASPVYKETFVVANVRPQEVKEWVLDVSAYDQDRYANHTELCNVRIPLKDVRKILQSPEIHMFNYRMKPSNLEFGNILLGISYLPTAQRLTINVMKARDIKLSTAVSSLENFNPYVRILMLNGRTGKKLKRKKTSCRPGSQQPEFNETLTFDLTTNQLDTVQFLVILCSKARVEEPSMSGDHPSDSEDSVSSSMRRSTDLYLGKVALGKGVRGPTERLHWFSVLQNPRNLVTVWHVLK